MRRGYRSSQENETAKRKSSKTKQLHNEIHIKSVIETYSAIVGLITKEVVERFGDEGRKVIAKACTEAGKYLAGQFLHDKGITERGTTALAKIAYPPQGSEYSWVSHFEFEHLELDDTSFSIKVTKCPSIDTWKALGIIPAIPDICDLLCHADNGVGIVYNPRLRLSLIKCMAKGDPYCIYLWKEVEKRVHEHDA